MAITIDPELCEGTGVCEQVCPEDVFEHESGRTTVAQPNLCSECWICVDQCTAGAIEID